MTDLIHVLHAIDSLNVSGGGTSRVTVDITDSLAQQQKIDITLLAQATDKDILVTSEAQRVRRVIALSTNKWALHAGIAFKRELHKLLSSGDINIVHSHGLWLPVNHWTRLEAVKNMMPLIIQPHGMLEPWALNYKRWKKRAAMFLYQHKDLASATLLIASSQSECNSIRQVGIKQPVAVIPNGISNDLILMNNIEKVNANSNHRTVLFLSRVHPTKGLLHLIRAWSELKPNGWRLRIAGPDDGNHLEEVMRLAKRLGVHETIDYIGEVGGKNKSDVYRSADIFVLPTFSENFGVVVTEALVHGLPVITTKGAPWSDLEKFKCGWWIDIGVEPLVDALQEAISLSDEERHEMGVRGKSYVRRYNWNDISGEMSSVYRWILGQGEQPSSVILD